MSYFRNLRGPDFGPFGGSVGGPFSLGAEVPFFAGSFLTRCGATVFGAGGAGLLRVITLPRGFPPLGIMPNLNGPSCGGSFETGLALLEGGPTFLSGCTA